MSHSKNLGRGSSGVKGEKLTPKLTPRIHSKKPPQRKMLQGLSLDSRGDWI